LDIEAWGAKAPAGQTLAGTSNAVTITLSGSNASANVTPSVPDEPASTNRVILVH